MAGFLLGIEPADDVRRRTDRATLFSMFVNDSGVFRKADIGFANGIRAEL
jgi:hypothetical protein